MLVVKGHTLSFEGRSYRCAIGKGGFSADKREGDGCTPLGIFSLRECWYRPDRMDAPKTGLPLKVIQEEDGWCDDPKSGEYNRHMKVPPAGGVRFEHLFRTDARYDLIVPIGYNDDPIVPGKGSAIFLHVAAPDYTPTEGCVALAKNDLLVLLPQLHTGARIEINKG